MNIVTRLGAVLLTAWTLAIVVPSAARAQGALASGAMATGAISPVGDADSWTLSATAGDAIVVRVGEIAQTGSFTVRVRLYSPTNVLLQTATGASAAEVAVAAGSSGTYTVVVDDAVGTSATGTYRITLAHTSEPVVVTPGDEGGPLTDGAMHTGTIDVGDLDVWTVSANAGDAILARAGETVPGSGFYPHLRLYSPTGAQLDIASGAAAAEVSVNAPTTGTYLVVVGDGNTAWVGSGAYRLTLVRSGDAITVSPGDEGGPLTDGAMHAGTIDVGDLDTWTLTANAGEAIVARMGETVAGSGLYPYVRIYSPAGVLLDYASGAAAAEVSVNAPTTGAYLVVVGDGNTAWVGSGAYRLTLVHSGDAITVSPGDEGGPLTDGAVHPGTIDVGDLDTWTLTATAGDAIVARVGEAVAGSGLYPYLRIFSPSGVQLDYASGAAAAEVAVNAPATGTYLVVVGDGNTAWVGSGTYRMTLVRTGGAITVSPGDEGGPLTDGAMHSGTIDVGDLDTWTLTANAGDAIVARMGETVAASVLYPYVRIFSPAGVLLGSGSGAAAAEVAVNAPSTGAYLVVVGDGNTAWVGSGAYRLTLARTGDAITVSPGDEGGPMTDGAMHTGTIDVGDLDVWTVSAAAGDAIVARMGETVAASVLYPYVRIYSPAGVLIDYASGAAAAEVAMNAPATGTYLVVVGDGNTAWVGSGTYRLTLARTGGAITVSPGDEGGPLNPGVSVANIDVGDLDVWTHTYNAGDPIVVTMEEVVVGSGLYPYLRLYGPTGTLLKYGSGASWTQVAMSAPSTGTYLIVAGDGNTAWVGSGAYRITPAATTAVPDAPGTQTFTLAFAPGMPNPFAARTLLKYTLPRDGAASLRVFDAQGRLVRTLVDEPAQAAGVHEATWDGRDAGGARLGPGVYMARLEAGGRPLVQKVVLSR